MERVLFRRKTRTGLKMSIALLLLAQCTIHQTINITIMNKKTNHKTRLKYQTSNTFKSKGGEKNNGKSITVQDEAYTIKELLEKHVQGLMPNVGLTPEYDSEDPHIDDDMLFRKQNLDLTDIDEIKQKVEETKTKIKSSKRQPKKSAANEQNDKQAAKEDAKTDDKKTL